MVSNDTVAPLYLDRVRAALGERQLITEVILPDGEQYKTLDTLSQIFDQVMADRHNRTTTFIAVGGGVVGDITGFAAACYQRGVSLFRCPPRCWPRWIPPWVARRRSITRWART